MTAFVLLLLLFSSAITAAPSSQMTITAQKVTCEKEKNTCVAEGEVTVTQEGKNQTGGLQTLTTDHLTVYFEPEKKIKSQQKSEISQDSSQNPLGGSDIKEIHAKGDVTVINGDIEVRSETSKYTAATDVVEFFGNVRINDPKRAYIESAYAAMNRKTGTYEVATHKSPKGDTSENTSKKVQIILSQKQS